MIINKINVRNFRCIENANLRFNDNLNIVVGNNGQGKTSLLESIYLLAFTKSHKTSHEKEVIKTDADFCKVDGNVKFHNYDSKFVIILTKKSKKVKINEIVEKKMSEYIGNINVVMFSPEDLAIIKGDPATKRRFIDVELGQTSPLYIHDLLMYRKILKQRNELLKKIQKNEINDHVLLDVITKQLVHYGSKILDARELFIVKLNSIIKKIHFNLTNNLEEVFIEYKKKHKNDLYEELKKRYQLDIITGSTSIGPHRDEFKIYFNKQDISVYGSQGQQRTAVLSIKLSLIEFIKQSTGELPILLLDDVFSELDNSRLNSLVEYIKKDIQTFITTTDVGFIRDELKKDATFFYVDNGRIKVGAENE
ncbi:DNA replication/repair protein RecF [Mycoplasmatota bacterium WC44]